MPMPVELTAEWTPLQRLSSFEFGAAVDQYESEGLLTSQNDDTEPVGLRAHYWSEDLDCHVHTLRGAIHYIRTATACNFKGMNIVGSNIEAALSWLDARSAEWYYPYPDEPLERIAVILGLGLALWVPNASQIVCEVALFSNVSTHRAREYMAYRDLGGWFEPLRDSSDFIPSAYQVDLPVSSVTGTIH